MCSDCFFNVLQVNDMKSSFFTLICTWNRNFFINTINFKFTIDKIFLYTNSVPSVIESNVYSVQIIRIIKYYQVVNNVQIQYPYSTSHNIIITTITLSTLANSSVNPVKFSVKRQSARGRTGHVCTHIKRIENCFTIETLSL